MSRNSTAEAGPAALTAADFHSRRAHRSLPRTTEWQPLEEPAASIAAKRVIQPILVAGSVVKRNLLVRATEALVRKRRRGKGRVVPLTPPVLSVVSEVLRTSGVPAEVVCQGQTDDHCGYQVRDPNRFFRRPSTLG